ncbi:arylmalonate decarboxylase [Alisedimentitalea sp. MJ-SS2]|uniref:maleate cis-trans isomerase family protein n=1 Tax=Aliisedimentitalea sp. MJ-SS2 TaxID=3049795 RepID=UPI00290AA420|nr:arylmalonate decarboxylase [Alisedimentitalea sp. MJ-SS2]MDU8928647.1 arylmalonate decarboxylase [Alisedimentitalea sp. MJ-SS2]
MAGVDDIFDGGAHPRAKIGFVLLATEQTIEDDAMRLCPEGVGMHFTRVSNPDSITLDSLTDLVGDLSRAASTLLPDGSLDVICYGCTSGSLVAGEDRVFTELNRGAPGAVATSLITGVIAAMQALDVRRIAVATPYLDEINNMERVYLEDRGFDVVRIEGLQLEKDSDMIRVRPDFIAEFAASLDGPEVDAVFISCGALRSLGIVGGLEQRLGKPVICSNQAMIWDCLRKAGIKDRLEGFGRLWREF